MYLFDKDGKCLIRLLWLSIMVWLCNIICWKNICLYGDFVDILGYIWMSFLGFCKIMIMNVLVYYFKI